MSGMCSPNCLPVELDQPVPVAVLLVVHGLQRLGRLGIILADALGQVGVNAAVLLLGLDGEGEDFLRGKFFERLGHDG